MKTKEAQWPLGPSPGSKSHSCWVPATPARAQEVGTAGILSKKRSTEAQGQVCVVVCTSCQALIWWLQLLDF